MQIRIDDGPPLAISALAAEHDIAPMQRTLPSGADGTRPTLEFLNEIADWLSDHGIADATPSIAWQFWRTLEAYRQMCAVVLMPQAEIAYWFHVDPFRLSEAEQLGLQANLYRLQCQERIYRRDYQATDYEGIYRLYRAAFDDEELAQHQKSTAFALYVAQCTQAK